MCRKGRRPADCNPVPSGRAYAARHKTGVNRPKIIDPDGRIIHAKQFLDLFTVAHTRRVRGLGGVWFVVHKTTFLDG